MVNNKVKFKVSIKELVFEYEGDQERATLLHGRLTDTLGSLAAAQSDAIDITPARQLPAAPAMPAQPAKRRRRARKPSANGDGAAAVSADGDGAGMGTEEKPARKRKPRGTSYMAQVKHLLSEDYFKQKRKEEEVREELVRRGHTFEQRRINDALLKLTQKQKLDRAINAANEWEYVNRPPA
jgi:hypothetical protein